MIMSETAQQLSNYKSNIKWTVHTGRMVTGHASGNSTWSPTPDPPSNCECSTAASTPEDERSVPPKRLRYWLVDMINSGEIEGLKWENPERTIFRIPWKHAGKNNWKEEDCKIFQVRDLLKK